LQTLEGTGRHLSLTLRALGSREGLEAGRTMVRTDNFCKPKSHFPPKQFRHTTYSWTDSKLQG
jgi:hypothetical protein